MKASKEIRSAAFVALFRTHCGARAMSAMLLLTLASTVVMLFLQQAFLACGVQSLETLALTEKWQSRDLPAKVLLFAASASLFAAFIRAVFAGIQNYGWANAALRGVHQASQGLFRGAFAGFKYPFGMFALFFGYALRLFLVVLPFAAVFGIALALNFVYMDTFEASPNIVSLLHLGAYIIPILALAPVLYVVYRCRFIWYLKAEHPDWRAGKCFQESAKAMKGLKMKAFYLDCSYWKPLTLIMLLALLGVLPFIPPVIRALCMGLLPVAAFFISVYMEFGRTVFYVEAKAKGDSPLSSENT